MTELELGQATIVYDDPDEGKTELTVDNEQLLYARDHWFVRTGTDDEGNDLMKQLPLDRVHYVDRNVEQFEEQTAGVRRRVESLANDLRQRLPVDIGPEPTGHETPEESTTVPIDESGDAVESEERA